MNLFIIGNSFSQNATRYLPQMAAEGGYELHLGRAEVGGCSLQRHWEAVEAEERGAPEGKFYTGKSLERADEQIRPAQSLCDLLTSGQWDVVAFHQGSLSSSDVSSYRPYAGFLVNYIRNLCPGARVILHQTWTYRCDAPWWGETGDGQAASGPLEMWQKSRAAYHTIAAGLNLPLIPTGDAFWKIESDPNWHYRPDPNFNFESPSFPDLPDQTHSLHAGYYWSQDRQFCLDFKHTSNAGAYLGSLMWYGFLFSIDPRQIQFIPPDVSPAFAAHLRETAGITLQEHESRLTPCV